MNFNFELILFYATLICGVLALIDILHFAPRRKKKSIKHIPIIFDYSRSFFPVLLLVFVLRSFVYEPFRIPSGSLKPTLLVGDFILVNKFDYGIRVPVIHKKIYSIGEPKKGDIVVFRWPVNPSIDFIKRVIGVPGDHISYINKILYVNGQKIPQVFDRNTVDQDDDTTHKVVQKSENFLGVQHLIYQDPDKPNDDFYDMVVPPGKYFMMGDNRDDSSDSRYWGLVPEENILGKATVIWMSWDANAGLAHHIRWNRIGRVIH